MTQSSPIGFSYDQFITSLFLSAHIKPNGSQTGWQAWKGDSKDPNHQVVEFTYHDPETKKYLNFRCWYIETSLAPGNASLGVSAKIDYERNTGDDHLVLLCYYDANGNILSAQVGVQFNGADQDNFVVKPVKASAVDNVAQAVLDTMNAQQQDVDYGGSTDNAGRHSFGYITNQLIQAFTMAVRATR